LVDDDEDLAALAQEDSYFREALAEEDGGMDADFDVGC
jgi:hypothetical protein